MNNADEELFKEGVFLGEVLAITKNALKSNGIENCSFEARELVCHAFAIDSVALICDSRTKADLAACQKLDKLISRRIAREPLARIIGRAEFFGNLFTLSKDTLEPRSDTQTLIESILADFNSKQDASLKILDLGTGSGAIAISLARLFNHAKITATDINAGALEVAQFNGVENGVDERIEFLQSDWCGNVEGEFDLIVSNPPYICSSIIPTLAIEVRDHDPVVALDGGGDGLGAYRRILREAGSKLRDNGRLYLEIGYDQGRGVKVLATELGWKFIRLDKDLGGRNRVVVFERLPAMV